MPLVVSDATLPSLVAAVRAALIQNPLVVAEIPGGFWHRYIPRAQVRPAVYYQFESARETCAGGLTTIETGQWVQVVEARIPGEAARIASLLAILLTDLEATWATGRLMYFRPVDPTSTEDPASGYGASLVQSERRVFDVTFQGSYLPQPGSIY
jgi:hypothetical protein